MKKIIYTPNAPQPVGPYSQAVISGNLFITSGQIGIDPATGKLVEGGIEHQARQVMENLKALLLAAGLDFSDVLKTTIFVTDISNFKLVNEIYGSYYGSNPPARETAQACKLPLNAELEISLMASLRE
jgi:2-iminobutanoate/2-iminopropanoate deaminase